MEGAINNIELLFAREFSEIHGVARNADRQLWVFLWVIHGIEQDVFLENVDIEVMSIVCEIAVEQVHQVVLLLLVRFSE